MTTPIIRYVKISPNPLISKVQENLKSTKWKKYSKSVIEMSVAILATSDEK